MTAALQPAPRRMPGPRGAGRLISLLGIAFTAFAVWSDLNAAAGWVIAVAVLALAAWLILVVLPPAVPMLPRLLIIAVMIVAGSLTSTTTASIASAVPLVGIITVLAATGVSLAVGFAFTASGLLAIAAGAFLGPPALQVLVSIAGVAVGVIVGLTRRQARTAAERELRTAAELVVANRQLAESAARVERARIARDLHDVLAHTLGGVVVQLDAVEALAEAGRVDEAAARAHSARALAADGLRDARIAVGVLDGTREIELAQLADRARALVTTERGLGAQITAEIADLHGPASPTLIDAFREATREALTNARKHAPGATVALRLAREGRMLMLEVSNEPAAGVHPLSGTGSGRGLDGIRDRISSLPGGRMSAEADSRGFRLSVRAEAEAEAGS